jgi:hypothetical protein
MVATIVGTLVLVLILGLQLVLAGDSRSVLPAVGVGLLVTWASIWLTRRAIARGRSPQEIVDWWFRLPVIGRFLRFSDRLNSRMGRGSRELLDDARKQRSSAK